MFIRLSFGRRRLVFPSFLIYSLFTHLMFAAVVVMLSVRQHINISITLENYNSHHHRNRDQLVNNQRKYVFESI